MRAWGFTVGLKLNWSVLEDSDGSQYYWDGNQGFWKGQIAVLSGPDDAKDLFTVLKGPDQQGGSECHWVVEGSLVFRAPYWVLMVHKWSRLVLYDPYGAQER